MADDIFAPVPGMSTEKHGEIPARGASDGDSFGPVGNRLPPVELLGGFDAFAVPVRIPLPPLPGPDVPVLVDDSFPFDG